MNPDNALTEINRINLICKELGLTYWLSAGTALAVHRDKLSDKSLINDTDIDIGILGNEKFKTLYRILIEKGYLPYREYSDEKGRNVQLAVMRHGILIDFYHFYPAHNPELLECKTEHGDMFKPASLVRSIKEVNIRGMNLPMLFPIEDYLEIRYGKSWEIPSKHAESWHLQCHNLVPKVA